jgi:hypothetical protein
MIKLSRGLIHVQEGNDTDVDKPFRVSLTKSIILLVGKPTDLGDFVIAEGKKSRGAQAQGLHVNLVLIHEPQSEVRICVLGRIDKMFPRSGFCLFPSLND